MLYNLRNGSTISLSVEKYLDMTDAELEKLEMYYRGAEINNPFFASVLSDKHVRGDAEELEDLEELDETEGIVDPDSELDL